MAEPKAVQMGILMAGDWVVMWEKKMVELMV